MATLPPDLFARMSADSWRVRLDFSLATRPPSRSRSYTAPRMFFTAGAPSVSMSATTRPRSRAMNVSASAPSLTFVASAPLPTIAVREPSSPLTSLTVSPASRNSPESRTPAGSILSACDTSPWKELIRAVRFKSRSFTALSPFSRRFCAAPRLASVREVESRLIASVMP